MHRKILPPTEEPLSPEQGVPNLTFGSHPGGTSKSELSNMDVLPVVLLLICGLFSGAFTIALLFRRTAIALAVTGPLLFSAIWVWRDWKTSRNKHLALGAFAVGFTLTFLALDREA